MTPVPTLIRRWNILIALTLTLMAVTIGLMLWRFSPLHVIMLLTQTVLALTQRASITMLKETVA